MAIHDIRDPAAVHAAIAEYDKVGRTYFLEKYGFGKAREFMLRDPVTGRLYDSKAVVGAAYGYAFPDQGPLRAADFSGGEATVEHLLKTLGFEVVRIGQDWTREEVEATVRDYFEMLELEARGLPFNKAEHNERLRLQLGVSPRTSSQAITYKGKAGRKASQESHIWPLLVIQPSPCMRKVGGCHLRVRPKVVLPVGK